MKYLAIIPILALTACASTEYAQYSKAQVDIATAKSASDTARYQALASIAKDGTDSARVAAVMALSMGNGTQAQTTQIAAPQRSDALMWASILVPGITQVAGMRYQYLGNKAASDNATALGMSTNSTFAEIAGQIQAPTTNVTTTLSGTGVLGSGTYSTQANPLTTTDRHDVTTSTPVVVPDTIINQPVIVPDTIINQPVIVPDVIQITPIAQAVTP